MHKSAWLASSGSPCADAGGYWSVIMGNNGDAATWKGASGRSTQVCGRGGKFALPRREGERLKEKESTAVAFFGASILRERETVGLPAVPFLCAHSSVMLQRPFPGHGHGLAAHCRSLPLPSPVGFGGVGCLI